MTVPQTPRDTPKVMTAARGTSRAAALRAAPKIGTQRARVLQAICGSHNGLTDAEIGAVTGLDGNSVRPRRLELLEGQHITSAGVRNGYTVWVPNVPETDGRLF